ncbi:predicted protein [Chaetomium globosum CBS 148.51]|uniref:Uncharacterized protein n=1 Tax=Chaetomium globosum (strain ATCC 6205 / CBS 148.51 / DSM 1962 / NBRC 6347 / NRRL 1970) TaxID=306901 RepID=Q2GT32_CHAGB|nr:uncharacterized protein CHGG_08872 [Chaetomium globosum CBS 148.51]EAQ84858.1 predicted protein [Chaetomium globosum CBS 148.51]
METEPSIDPLLPPMPFILFPPTAVNKLNNLEDAIAGRATPSTISASTPSRPIQMWLSSWFSSWAERRAERREARLMSRIMVVVLVLLWETRKRWVKVRVRVMAAGR